MALIMLVDVWRERQATYRPGCWPSSAATVARALSDVPVVVTGGAFWRLLSQRGGEFVHVHTLRAQRLFVRLSVHDNDACIPRKIFVACALPVPGHHCT